MSKEWFDRNGYSDPRLLNPCFEEWWFKEYGPPENFGSESSEQDAYWIKKGFALLGWTAAKENK